MPDFIPGLELSRRFYLEAVKPVLDTHFPELLYDAALIGPGSEVIGFDTPMSTDHHWGPRLMLFLDESEIEAYRDCVTDTLAHVLPYEFYGHSTHFGPPDPEDGGTRLLENITEGPVDHRVEMYSVRSFFEGYLGIDPGQPIGPRTWLTLPQHHLLTVTTGAVYHDGLGKLKRARARLAYYPRDVWLYMLAAQWQRIGQEEHLMGRCGYVGDEVGAALIGARLVRDVMMLCFLMERQYAPYPKWFGTAFKRLESGQVLYPRLASALAETTWQAREAHLVVAYEHIAVMHNALDITPPLPTKTSQFHNRPFQIIQGERFANAIWETIQDEAVRALTPHIGSVDQLSDSADLYSYPDRSLKLKNIY